MTTAASTFNLSKEFPSGDTYVRVLDNISVDIRLGELTMLIGPSGCGKTTLISILSGILSPTTGSVSLLGTPLSNLSNDQKTLLRRENVGFIFQQYNLIPTLTAAENAALPLIAADTPYHQALAVSKKTLERVGLSKHAHKSPKQLSGGEQQRVAIARALVHHPKLIICDEPTAALDAKTGRQILELLRSIADDPSHAILVVSHDDRIYPFADRILEMKDGKIVRDSYPKKSSSLR